MPKLNFLAQNTIDNIGGKVIKAGDVVPLDDKVAEPFVKTGSLVQTEASATPDEKTKESGKGDK
jgi:hypothetical protein